MPELPEVETLRRGLAARITGMCITAAEILDRKIFDGPDDAIMQDVVDHQISRVARGGKVLILFLRESRSSPGESGSLLIHPKMTGQLVLTAGGVTVFAGGHPTPSILRPMPNPTTRAVFRLGPAYCLYHNDARRFGWIRLAGPDPCRTDPFLSRLGPDPLGAGFTPAALRQALARHPRAPVKAVLLDQTAIAGIGNIYADEVLHRARIHPSRPAGGLSQAGALRLHAAIRTILRAAADSDGTSFAGYVNQARGRPGYLGQARVFRRQGLPCLVCGTLIIRATVGGRATTSARTASNAETAITRRRDLAVTAGDQAGSEADSHAAWRARPAVAITPSHSPPTGSLRFGSRRGGRSLTGRARSSSRSAADTGCWRWAAWMELSRACSQ